MADPHAYRHDASDKKLDQTAGVANGASPTHDTQHSTGAGHDPAEIRKHDDIGTDRLFEDRQQHDEAEKNSEKSLLARDVQRHGHTADADLTDAGTDPSAKRKS